MGCELNSRIMYTEFSQIIKLQKEVSQWDGCAWGV